MSCNVQIPIAPAGRRTALYNGVNQLPPMTATSGCAPFAVARMSGVTGPPIAIRLLRTRRPS